MKHKNTKNSLLILLISFIILLLPLNASAKVLFGEKYQQALHKHLTQVKESITILEHTAADGKAYKTNFYNLDTIISVGYRVNSAQATHSNHCCIDIYKCCENK